MFIKIFKSAFKLNLRLDKLADEALIERYCQTHDMDCIGELFNRYTHLVFGVALKFLKNEAQAQDAVMQIFEKLLQDIPKHTIDNFKGWLYIVSKNHCLMELRIANRISTVSCSQQNIIVDSMENDLDLHLIHENEKLLLALENAILMLTEEQRICIDLMYLKQNSYKQIVNVTGYNENQVKSFIQNGKRNLKIILENNAK